jgi:hypothetical protein
VTYVNCPQVDSTRRAAAAAAAATAAANHAATSRKQTAQESRRKLNQPQENQGENHTKRTAPASHIGISTVDKYKQIVIVAIHTYIYTYTKHMPDGMSKTMSEEICQCGDRIK